MARLRLNNFQPRPRTALAFACAALALAALPGCARRNPIVGKWRGQVAGPMGITAQINRDFRADGSDFQSYAAMGRAANVQTEYKAENGILTETYPPGPAIPFVTPTHGNTKTYNYKVDGDTLTLTEGGSGIAVVLHREKS